MNEALLREVVEALKAKPVEGQPGEYVAACLNRGCESTESTMRLSTSGYACGSCRTSGTLMALAIATGIRDPHDPEEAAGTGVNTAPRITGRSAQSGPWSCPSPLGDAAFHGVLGEIVRAIEPNTEAHPAALLLDALVCFGSVIGRGRYVEADGCKHHSNLFVVLVGKSARARKGTSRALIRRVFLEAEPVWSRENIDGGLNSGEGLIARVRDPLRRAASVDDNDHGAEVGIDPGVADKRLLVVESEFANMLRVMKREANTLSALVREAWDTGNLTTMVKWNRMRATNAHVSIIGHVTEIELKRTLSVTDRANGFANRFLWVWIQRSKLLPYGGQIDPAVMEPLIRRLQEAIAFSRKQGQMAMDADALGLWREVYEDLTADLEGDADMLLSRAEAQVLRLALIFALQDMSPVIRCPHLASALDVWDYCKSSTIYLFGGGKGDRTTEKIATLLADAGPRGMSRNEFYAAFGGHIDKATLDRCLDAFEASGGAEKHEHSTGGRPETRWCARKAKEAREADAR